MLGASKTDIFDMAEDIAFRYAARDYLKTAYDYKTGEVEFLLSFQDPLELAADCWAHTVDNLSTLSGILSIGELTEQASHGHYAKVMDAANPASKENTRKFSDIEKPSVLERIREAAKLPKEPRKDKPARNKSELEL